MVMVLAVGAAGNAEAARPTKLVIFAGIAEVRNVVYDPGTPEDLNLPAKGTGDLVINIKLREFTKQGIRFEGALTDAAGKVRGLAVTLADPFVLDNLFGTGAGLTIPTGQLSYLLPDKLTISGQGSARLPFRNKNGTPVELNVKTLQGSVDATGTVKFTLDEVGLKAPASTEGITLPGINVKAAPFDVEFAWSPSTDPRWAIKAPSVEVQAGIPGVSTDPEYPVKATVQNLAITQDATVTFDMLTIGEGSAQPPVKLSEAPGFELKIRSGTIRFPASGPVFEAIKVDLTLPQGVTQENSTSRVTIQNLSVQIQDGLLASIGSLRCQVRSLKLLSPSSGAPPPANAPPQIILDLSRTASHPNARGRFASDKAWMGLLIKQGAIEVPTGGQDKLSATFQDFVIEPQGVSGSATLTATNDFKVSGFSLKPPAPATPPVPALRIELKQSQLKEAAIAGRVKVGEFPEIDAEVSFDLDGNFAFRVTADEALEIGSVGIKINNLQGQLEGGSLVLSGDLGVDGSKFPGNSMPEGLKKLNIAVKDLKVSSTGEFSLPAGGMVTFPEPQPIDFGPLAVEIRQFGFTSSGGQIDSVLFSGGAGLKGMDDVLPIGGELEFEGFSIKKDLGGGLPKFELGGIGFEADVLGIGSLRASLFKVDPLHFPVASTDGGPTRAQIQQLLNSFGDTFAGDAELTLSCLGEMKGGIGLTFFVAPNVAEPLKSAFFVGGHVMIPTPILVQIPPAGTTPPVPLFNILGFSGGFGINVAPRDEGVGRISDPILQLKEQPDSVLLQAGLLLGDPTPPPLSGKIWWADATLTLTINPVTIDLTARASFLDFEGPGFLSLADWKDRDRIAEAFVNLNFAVPAFTVGGSADLTFPTRSARIIRAEGEVELKIQRPPNQSYLRVGWEEEGQRPLKLTFLEAISGIADLSAQAGLEVLLPTFKEQNGHLIVDKPASGDMFLRIDAVITTPVAEIDGHMEGTLTLQNIGQASFSGSGSLDISAKADFGFFVAECDGSVDASFSGDELTLSGQIHGEVAGFEGSASFDKTLKAGA